LRNRSGSRWRFGIIADCHVKTQKNNSDVPAAGREYAQTAGTWKNKQGNFPLLDNWAKRALLLFQQRVPLKKYRTTIRNNPERRSSMSSPFGGGWPNQY
jgi:hypothetical protein